MILTKLKDLIPAPKDGKGVSSTNIYYKADSSTPSTPSGAPASNPSWADNGNSLITNSNATKHLYESTCTTYTDGTYSWSTPIDDGLIQDMASTAEQFALADSGTTAPSSGWSTSVTPTAGKWIWSRTVLTFKDSSTKVVNTQCIGYCGTNGKGVTGANIYYLASASTPSTPSGAPASNPSWADNGSSLITKSNASKHLWESTCTTYTDGNYSWSTPIDDGLIQDMASTAEQFALADSGSTAPSSGWSASVTPTAGNGYGAVRF